ncbi:hypothetical protein Tco_0106506 [Tanacetum coccineum]
MSITSSKRSLWNVILMHSQLMVSGPKIYLRESIHILCGAGTGAYQIRITLNSDLIKDRPTFVSTDWRHPRRSRATTPLDRSLNRPLEEETKKRSSQSLQARLNFGLEDEVSPPRHQKERRGKDNRRPPVFGRIGKKVSGTQTANLQNLDTHENNDWRISVRDRLGSRDVHSRLGQRRSPSESPPSSDSEDSRRKRRRRVSSSS